jgi:hypothetical protein
MYNNFIHTSPPVFRDFDLSSLGYSCAIVGSSGNLLDNEYGEIIDSYDVVIRFNDALVSGYEKHVGSKTTCRVVNQHIFNAAMPNTHIDLERMKELFSAFDKDFIYSLENQTLIGKGIEFYPSFKGIIDRVKERNNEVVFINKDFYEFCNKQSNSIATCGFVAVNMALKHFVDISCFGFSFYERSEGDRTKLHYWEELGEYDQSCHDFSDEKKIMKGLHDFGLIEIYPEIK